MNGFVAALPFLKRISVPQIRANTALEAQELLAAGEDPFVYAWQREPDQSIAYRQVSTTFSSASENYEQTHPDLKRRRYLTAVEWTWLKKFVPQVRYYCKSLPNTYYGVVTGGRPCLASEVGERGERIVESVRRFFENTAHNCELFLTVLHTDKLSGCNASGQPLVHVHAHFLFVLNGNTKKRRRFLRSFYRKFPNGSRVERVRHIQAKISYLLRTPNLRPLREAGGYVDWARSVSGKRRIICAGGLRRARKQWKKDREKIGVCRRFDAGAGRWLETYFLRPALERSPRTPAATTPRIIEPNTIVGTTTIKGRLNKFTALIMKNA